MPSPLSLVMNGLFEGLATFAARVYHDGEVTLLASSFDVGVFATGLVRSGRDVLPSP
jgi:hypothetical protein